MSRAVFHCPAQHCGLLSGLKVTAGGEQPFTVPLLDTSFRFPARLSPCSLLGTQVTRRKVIPEPGGCVSPSVKALFRDMGHRVWGPAGCSLAGGWDFP